MSTSRQSWAIRDCSSTPSSTCCSTRAMRASQGRRSRSRFAAMGATSRSRSRTRGSVSRSQTSGARSSHSSRPKPATGEPGWVLRSRTRLSPVTAAAWCSRNGARGAPALPSAFRSWKRLRLGKRRPRVLVVDDNLEMARTVSEGLIDRGYDAVPVGSGRDAIDRLTADRFDVVVTDLRMPKVDGMELLAASRKLDPDRPVIVMTAYSAIDTAVESIRQGAYHYLTKPFKQDELVIFLERALDQVRFKNEASALRTALRAKFSVSSIIGHSPAIQAVRERIQRVADAPAPVIVLGETGTGKGIVARALHGDSRRADRPFVSVNCAALPEALLESELFGYVKGAFTGAASDRPGLFAEAEGGSLFFDEIGEMPSALQAKLLHVLESGTVRPVGSTKEREIDVRIIAATHRNLVQAAREGKFREDLLY